MSNLFTSYESLEPPAIVSPSDQQDYQEYQQLNLDTDTDNSLDLDAFSDMELRAPVYDSKFNTNDLFKNEDLQQPVFKTTTSSQAQNVINVARQFVGTSYRWGGSSPSTGFDCSGLMQYAFKAAGINLPRTAAEQGKKGQAIDISQAQPGDVIWFGSKNSPSGNHIGLVSQIKNGQIYIIDAAGKKLGVKERPLPNLQIKSVRRLLGNEYPQQQSGSFASTVLNYFKGKGLSEAQSRGILGNLMQESRGNHNITNKKSGAYGIAQWLGPRKQKLFQQYGNSPTLKQQLDFIWQEFQTTEKSAFQKLLNTNTVADATRVFAQSFERGAPHEMVMNKRINFAYQA